MVNSTLLLQSGNGAGVNRIPDPIDIDLAPKLYIPGFSWYNSIFISFKDVPKSSFFLFSVWFLLPGIKEDFITLRH
jgi:hypothetical protein